MSTTIALTLAEQLLDSTDRIALLNARWARLWYGAEDGDDVYGADQAMQHLEAERTRYQHLLTQVPYRAGVGALDPGEEDFRD